ncbi:MAG: hypothetical protein HY260_11740 [Chloroflexi bacterium]|nr:hypothetical protein [Chloroflexota bacterium]
MRTKRSSQRRAPKPNRGLYILSLIVVTSLALSAIFALLPTPQEQPTPTFASPGTATATTTATATPEVTQTTGASTPPAPTLGPALAPTR